ncbi:MAG: OmpH family outer membrane protein [Sodaliphilus pleomorphus]|uniref:OmpH family outer membrane protein n=1 Tax=Sodaliphilus pleomorphus TaxID=2606626 RepID=UPI0023F31AD2|nr:OmpH family outer membrane protein [Sodaliphilus pleomorphus]MCI5980746.1 OmpH family outer membrane protein [Muribaculaceae bacterium]MDD7066376.1 OmpH family outer membrane protein [Sodaliphilus pleomorphus]MDY2833019.1 OmpH family outer membrane protein [Sodaliphilus pleomorphus]
MTAIKTAIIALAAAAPLCLAAQSKVATVDVEAVYNAMPEKMEAEAQLKAVSQQYKAEYESVQKEFNQKYADYQALDPSTPSTIKERRMQEIQESDKKIQAFLKQADADLAKREQELNAPIKAKIAQAIKTVGSEEGYTYIIDSSKGTIVYAGADAVDVTAKVKAKLGLQ